MWADFFKGKYARGNHLSLLVPNKDTRFWKSIVKSIPDVLNNSKWLVREGNISFWYDNWEEGGPLNAHYPVLEQLLLRIKDICIENGWDIALLEMLVGHQKASDLVDLLSRRKEGQGVFIWLKEKDGNFTTKSAWKCIRVRAPPLTWAHWIWPKFLPRKISIMMWKASNNWLSVDDKVKLVGIPMASKCNYCSSGHTEDLNHVLVLVSLLDTYGDWLLFIWVFIWVFTVIGKSKLIFGFIVLVFRLKFGLFLALSLPLFLGSFEKDIAKLGMKGRLIQLIQFGMA